ncbi:hypothetical protein ACE3MZ_13070 [Paenibacillus sp. WLX1005]|uniref:hypothetical protein n=1 Tax=Paenibacillus sp. WLX1005 TaxID=3243766 RepID=UPI00398456BD
MADTSTKEDASKSATVIDDAKYDAVVKFPEAKYPQTASHIMTAIAKGKPAVCTIDRAGADVAYVASSDNRGAGSWVGNKLSDYPDGPRILFTMAVEEK